MKIVVLGLLTMIGVVGSARDSLAAVNPDSASSAGAVAAERGFEGAVVEIEVGQKGLMDLGQAKTDIGCGYRPPCSIVRLRRRSLGLPLSKFLNSLLLAGRSRSSTRRLDLRCWRHHFRRKQE